MVDVEGAEAIESEARRLSALLPGRQVFDPGILKTRGGMIEVQGAWLCGREWT